MDKVEGGHDEQSSRSKIGALLVKPALKKTLKSIRRQPSTAERRFLGLNGLVVKTHGSSKAQEVSQLHPASACTFKEQRNQ